MNDGITEYYVDEKVIDEHLKKIDPNITFDENSIAYEADLVNHPPHYTQGGIAYEADLVNHPPHYTQGGIECIDAIEAACTGLTGKEGYYVGQVIKYIWRWKRKNGLQDLEKAQWYLNRLIANVKENSQ